MQYLIYGRKQHLRDSHPKPIFLFFLLLCDKIEFSDDHVRNRIGFPIGIINFHIIIKPELISVRIPFMPLSRAQKIGSAPFNISFGSLSLHPVRRFISLKPVFSFQQQNSRSLS